MIAVDDLHTAVERFTTLGFDVVNGGRHEGLGTENAIVRFGLDYLELLTVYDETLASASGPNRRMLVELLRQGPRAAGFALATRDIASLAKELTREGLEGTQPVPMKRVRPDGSALTWRVLHPTGTAWSQPWPFFIQWDASDADRLASESIKAHPNATNHLVGVGVLVQDLRDAIELYRKMGLHVSLITERRDVGARSAVCRIGDFAIELLSPVVPGLAQRALGRAGQGLFEVVFSSEDTGTTLRYFAKVFRRSDPYSHDGFAVGPEDAFGARLAVVPASNVRR